MSTKPRLLWVGDACVSSGFARATHRTLNTLKETFDVSVLGMNYHGDPHEYPYPIYPCSPGGDYFGLGRLTGLIAKTGPSVIVVQNDPWNFQPYIERAGNVPVVGLVAVDGKNCQGTQLNGLSLAIFWTKFGEEQAKLGGYTGPSTVVPLGVDLEVYSPQDREALREKTLAKVFANRGLPKDTFVIGVVGRNQQRKRLDLTMEYFAHWIKTSRVSDAVLWLHVAPTGDQAYDLRQLGDYYRISNRVITPTIEERHGLTEKALSQAYNFFDVMATTTQGEGFGLPCLEGMACGVPQIVPDWSALGEWTKEAAWKVLCTTFAVTPNGINVLGGIADKDLFVQALDGLYHDKALRASFAQAGLTLSAESQFRWDNIGRAVGAAIEQALYGVTA